MLITHAGQRGGALMHNRDEDSNAGPRKGSNMEIERVKERKKERERKRDIMQTGI